MYFNQYNGPVYRAMHYPPYGKQILQSLVEAIDSLVEADAAGETWPAELNAVLKAGHGWDSLGAARAVLDVAPASQLLSDFVAISDTIGSLCSLRRQQLRENPEEYTVYSDAAHACVLAKAARLAMPEEWAEAMTASHVAMLRRQLGKKYLGGPWHMTGAWGIRVLGGMSCDPDGVENCPWQNCLRCTSS